MRDILSHIQLSLIGAVLAVQLLFSVEPSFGALSCRSLIDRTQVRTQSIVPYPDLPARERTQLIRKIENDAIDALSRMVKPNAEVLADVQTWFQRIEQRSNRGESLTIMEHSALTYLIDRKIFEYFPEPALKDNIVHVLSNSWRAKTGSSPDPTNLIQALPAHIRNKMSREESLYHKTIFEIDGKFSSSRPVNKIHIATAAALLGFAFSKTGGDMVSASIIGYFGATMAEHAIHKYGGHGTTKLKQITERIAWLGKFIKDTSFGHAVVHHGLTYKQDYATQFRDRAEEVQLKKLLFERFGITQKEVEQIARSKYGASLSTKGVLQGLAGTAPAYLAASYLLGFGPIASFAMLSPTAAYIALSKSVHPYMHMSRTEVLQTAPRFIRWILTSRYGEWVSRHHWIHHKGGGGNYNLLHLGIGGDSLMGELKNPTLEQIIEMRKLDLIGASWD